MTVPNVDPITTAVVERLRAVHGARLQVFDGEPKDVLEDGDSGARPYAAVYPSAGEALALTLCGQATEARWSAQITCAGADRTRCMRAVERVRAALSGWTPTVPGLVVDPLSEPDDYAPQVRIDSDSDVQPARTWAPLQFAAYVTTTQ